MKPALLLLSKRRTRGMATLTIAVLVLVVLMVMTLFAIRMGLFEQRTSVNDNRAQLVETVAEGALNQGTEYIKANSRLLLSTSEGAAGLGAGWLSESAPRWQPCSEAFAGEGFDPCLSEPDEDRRSQMYRFLADGSTEFPLEDLMGTRQLFDEVGGFPVEYRVSATLCRVVMIGTEPVCQIDPEQDSQVAITLVSEAQLPTENATARMRQIIASFRLLPEPPNVPLVAANVITGLGSAEIVPNPNAGGAGVPLSIWANSNVDITKEAGGAGAFTTCHLGEWLGNFTSSGPENYDGIQRCEACSCKGLGPEDGLLSGKDPGTPGYEGIDVMDVDGNGNGDLPDTSYFPKEPLDDPNNDFDDSIFEYVLGGNSTDEGATSPRMDCVSDENPGGNCETQHLIDLGAEVVATCAGLNSASAGLYWVAGECSLGSQVGTPSNPVMLVVEGCMKVSGQTEFYGLIYQRASACTDLSKGFAANGGGQLYGAIVVDAPVKIAGSVQFIYNDTVLKNLASSAAFKRYGVLPGSWSDEACFDEDRNCLE